MGSSSLFQVFNASAEVDVVGEAVQYEGGHGFHAGFLGFGYARFARTEVDDFDVVAFWIKGGGDILFGGDADRATGVIEDSFRFHGLFSFVCWLVIELGQASRKRNSPPEGTIREGGYQKVPSRLLAAAR